MKLKKIKFKKYKMLKLHLLKSQVYLSKITKKNLNMFVNNNLERSELHAKKAFKIIYEYHYNNYKILFIGFPTVKNKAVKNLLKSTHHFFIPSNLWVNSFLANYDSIFRFLKLNRLTSQTVNRKNLSLKKINTLLSIRQKPRLIVIFDEDINSDMLKELGNLNVPIILFGNNFCFERQITYSVPGNFFFVRQKVTNIFSYVLCSIFDRKRKLSWLPVLPARRKI